HPRDAGAAGDAQHVLGEHGIERRAAERTEHREPLALAIRAEEPFGESTVGLALDDEVETTSAALEVAHRIRSISGHGQRSEQDELPGVEIARLLELHAERHDIGRDLTRCT